MKSIQTLEYRDFIQRKVKSTGKKKEKKKAGASFYK